MILKKPPTKSGPNTIVSPWILVVINCFVICCTGQSIAAVDPFQEMLKANGAFGHLDDPLDRENAIKSCVGLGLSCSVLSGLIVGPFLDYVGPKITAICGLGLQISGFCLLFLTKGKLLLCIGSICLGFAFQAVLNSHMSVSCFFPENVSFVLAVLGAAPEISLFIPAQMKRLAEYSGVNRVVIYYIVFILGLCLILDSIFLPLYPYTTYLEQRSDSQSEPVNPERRRLQTVHSTSEFYDSEFDYGQNTSDDFIVGTCNYWSMGLKDHLKTSHFWIVVPFFVGSFCRRKHFASNLRTMFTQLSGDPKRAGAYADAFNSLVAFGFLPAIIWGLATDRVGVAISMLVSNIFGLGVSIIPMIPIMQIQALSIICYIFFSSYVFGILFAYCATTFGFHTLATLQGITSSIAGLFSLMMDAKWNDFITDNLGGSFVKANAIVTLLGLLLFVTPLFVIFWPPPMGVNKTSRPAEGLDADVTQGRLKTTTIITTGQLYDKLSIAAMQQKTMPVLTCKRGPSCMSHVPRISLAHKFQNKFSRDAA